MQDSGMYEQTGEGGYDDGGGEIEIPLGEYNNGNQTQEEEEMDENGVAVITFAELQRSLGIVANAAAAKARRKHSDSNALRTQLQSQQKQYKKLMQVWLIKRRSVCSELRLSDTRLFYPRFITELKPTPLTTPSLHKAMRSMKTQPEVFDRLLHRHFVYTEGVNVETIPLSNFLHRLLYDGLMEVCNKVHAKFVVDDQDPRNYTFLKKVISKETAPDFAAQPPPLKRQMRELKNNEQQEDGEDPNVATTAISSEQEHASIVSWYVNSESFGKPPPDIVLRRMTWCSAVPEMCSLHIKPVSKLSPMALLAAAEEKVKRKVIANCTRILNMEYHESLQPIDLEGLVQHMGQVTPEMYVDTSVPHDAGIVSLLETYLHYQDKIDALAFQTKSKTIEKSFDVDHIVQSTTMGEPTVEAGGNGGGGAHAPVNTDEPFWDQHCDDEFVEDAKKKSLLFLSKDEEHVPRNLIGAKVLCSTVSDGGQAKVARLVFKDSKAKLKSTKYKWDTVAQGIYNGINAVMRDNNVANMFHDGTIETFERFMGQIPYEELVISVIKQVADLHDEVWKTAEPTIKTDFGSKKSKVVYS